MTTLPIRAGARGPRGRAGSALAVPRTKRWFDVAVCGAALVLLAPLLAVLALAVRLTSRGPVIFRQERLGLGGRPFAVLKFRTMYAGAGDALHRSYVTLQLTQDGPVRSGDGGLFKLEHDPRVTRVGRWLRRTSLDELPQLVNVLRGEMSLVGPRPALAWEAALYRDGDHARFEVLPGITGLWQVSGRSRLPMREALALDVEYARRRTFLLDLQILARTVPTVLRREAT